MRGHNETAARKQRHIAIRTGDVRYDPSFEGKNKSVTRDIGEENPEGLAILKGTGFYLECVLALMDDF